MPGPETGLAPVLVLAAGRGTRMGGPKALMMVGVRPWWQVQRERLTAARVPTMWVVSAQVRQVLASSIPGIVMATSDSDAPMFASIRAGAQALSVHDPLPGMFVLPVDVPAPGPAVWSMLQSAGAATVPTHHGNHGHPIYVAWDLVVRHILGNDDPSARLDQLIAPNVRYIPVDDPSVMTNLNTPQAVEAWESSQPHSNPSA